MRALLAFVLVCQIFAFSAQAEEKTFAQALLDDDQAELASLEARGGFDPDAVLPDYYGATALMITAEKRDPKSTRVLLAMGADVLKRDKNGDMALQWAAYFNATQVTDLLLEAGADPAASGAHGTAYQIALRRGYIELARTLARVQGTLKPWTTELEDLEKSFGSQAPEVVKEKFLALGKSTPTDRIGRPWLHVAAEHGRDDLIDFMLDSGVDVDATDPIGMTALMVAARAGSTRFFVRLLEAGADPRHVADASANSMSVAHFAGVGGDQEIIQVLWDRKVDFNVWDSDGVTPMMWALSEGHQEAIAGMIALGIDPEFEMRDGTSVAGFARDYGMDVILAAMK